MKPILVKCGICENWHSYGKHCANCGAYHFTLRSNGHATCKHFNVKGIEMVRGVPPSLDSVIQRVISRSN